MIEIYSILVLVLIYLGVNVYYKNIKAIVLFLVSFVSLVNVMKNKLYALLIAYSISISYNIMKNFHLLENFSNKKEEKVPIIPASYKELKELNTLTVKKDKKLNIVEDPIIEKEKEKEKEEVTEYYYDDEIVSKELINKFIDTLERKTTIKITKTKKPSYKLKPTLSTLDIDTVERLKNQVEYSNMNLLENYVTVSKDNYIINGHYTWYVKKLFLEEKNENTLIDEKYVDLLNVRIIDLEIEPLMKKLDSYKIEYNSNALQKFTLDKNKLTELKSNINNLKKTVKNLEMHYNELTKIKVL